MSTAPLGLVLAKMANYARERAESRRDFLGPENTELLWAIAHTFATGAECCLEVANADDGGSAA